MEAMRKTGSRFVFVMRGGKLVMAVVRQQEAARPAEPLPSASPPADPAPS